MAAGLNTWHISCNSIVLENPGGTMSGWSWRDGAMRHTTGKVIRFTPALTAEIDAAVAGLVPARSERKYGHEFTEADRAEGGWEFAGVQGDALGVYTRFTPGSRVSVGFAKSDVAS